MIKKGQVTVFIIVGIVMALVLGITAFLMQKVAKERLPAEGEQSLVLREEPLQQAVDNCVQDSLERAVFFISRQGGYYHTPPPYFEFAVFDIPYYFDQQVLSVPTKAEIEKNLAEFIKHDFAVCEEEIKRFPQKITIAGEPTVQVSLFPSTIRAAVTMPLRLHIEESIVTVDQFHAKINSELNAILEVRDLLLQEQKKYPEAVRLSEVVQLAEERNIPFTLENIEGTVLYQLGLPPESPPQEKPNQGKLLFTFAIRYPWNEPSTDIEENIIEENIIGENTALLENAEGVNSGE